MKFKNFTVLFFLLYFAGVVWANPVLKLKVKPKLQTPATEEIPEKPAVTLQETCESPGRKFVVRCTVKDEKGFGSICHSDFVNFEPVDTVAEEKYRSVEGVSYSKINTRNASDFLSADGSGQKMTYGLALRLCESKGMRLPTLAELYSAIKNNSEDQCALKPDEYWSEFLGWQLEKEKLSGYIASTYSVSHGLSAVNTHSYLRVRCVEK